MRRISSLVLLLALVAIPAHADRPSNDDPAGAVVIDSVPATLQVDTSEATPGPFEESCYATGVVVGVRTPESGVWFTFDLPEEVGSVEIEHDGSASVVLWEREGVSPTGAPILRRRGCAYPDADWGFEVSDTTYMSVSSLPALSDSGPHEITIQTYEPEEDPPVPNDAPYRATRIPSLPYEVEQNTYDAGFDRDPLGCENGAFVWYTYTPSTAEAVSIDVENRDFDSATIAVYALGENVETLGCAEEWDGPARVTTALDAGVPILIGIGSYGALRLSVELLGAPEYPDDRSAAAPLGFAGSSAFDTAGATLEPGEPESCGSGGSLWYELPARARAAAVRVTGDAALATVSGDTVLSCSTSGRLSVPRGEDPVLVQVRGTSSAGTISFGFDPAFGVQVSDRSPFEDDCSPVSGAQMDTEVEVSQAVDPDDPDHLVMAWQQDRHLDGGGAQGVGAAVSFDGGDTWTKSVIPGISACTGGPLWKATDPWAAIDADGTAYVMTLGYNSGPTSVTYLTNTVLINRSHDGGLTWSEPTVVAASPGILFHDKETLTADPNTPGLLYAVWDAYPTNVAFPVFARSEDHGRTWTPPVPLPTLGSGAGDQIAVLDDGTLVEIAPRSSMQSITSRDRGVTWSRTNEFARRGNSEGPPGVRGGAYIPSVATDGRSVFVSWSDTYSTWFARSDDAGDTWAVEEVAGSGSYPTRSTTAVAATDDGTIAVMTYVVRPGGETYIELATSEDGGSTWSTAPITDPFDIRRAPYSQGRGYFLGDYFGLSASGSDVVAALSVVPEGTREPAADIYSLRVALD